MCKGFSTLMGLNVNRMDPAKLREIIAQCMTHLKFVCRLYQMQIDGGRWFLHEHPWGAWSWQVDCVQDLLKQTGVAVVEGHMCPHGQHSYSDFHSMG